MKTGIPPARRGNSPIEAWRGEFGRACTDRNAWTLAEMEEKYRHTYGLSRTEMNRHQLEALDRNLRILEVGANIGNQLLCLQQMGFTSLYGIELQEYAVELARQRIRHINLLTGVAHDLPFKDGFFDLVFTSGVLIHIAPAEITAVLREIHRCTRRYIWGFEYFAERYTEVNYRGHDGLLWKTDFARLYLDTFPDLRLPREDRYRYLGQDLTDTMFLLERIAAPASHQ
ncbi:MAG: methyltransferase domain-containing protein [candidate division KSB1 bacterium]|nr:methyltransferase domain-containing protein [candidate division KSB1 bacterium]MDZ7274905.1 methyltransferase domain-containing protein [candidate division KSB1 bacterium]MDZ7286643.1 methyltransferase domain-containing protein [candidate division KSB1 bacterium]MDZ7299194.1 methyltransferase domain-containing protein [candidate division KSB1 bacterium]MDZ7308498.1 methyltransferase domain-containing protein [candidate division KSB1 bacterium]